MGNNQEGNEYIMKSKDLICIIGAPVKTAVEVLEVPFLFICIIGVLSAITGAVFGVIYIIYFGEVYLRILFHISHDTTIEILEVASIIVGGILIYKGIMKFIYRTKQNYDACKEYWNEAN